MKNIPMMIANINHFFGAAVFLNLARLASRHPAAGQKRQHPPNPRFVAQDNPRFGFVDLRQLGYFFWCQIRRHRPYKKSKQRVPPQSLNQAAAISIWCDFNHIFRNTIKHLTQSYQAHFQSIAYRLVALCPEKTSHRATRQSAPT